MKKTTPIGKRAYKAFTQPKSVAKHLVIFLSPVLSDKIYLKLLFPLKVGYKLDLKAPKTYNEKLQWLKLYYRDSTLPLKVDKFEYKKFVTEVLGSSYTIKTYGIWKKFKDIDFKNLPNQFVLKTTHDQGSVIICKDKSNFDFREAENIINYHLKRNLYYLMREWPYKYIEPRIIAEELLIDHSKDDVWDYKFYCFDGEPKYMYISMDRESGHAPFYFYDMEFNFLPIRRPNHDPGDKKLEKPANWEKMIGMARILSNGQPHVRIDFYNVNGKIFTGEFTLFQGGGMMPFIPKKWDFEFGKFIKLPAYPSTIHHP